MKRMQLGHVLAAVVGTIAVLNTLSALSMPVADRKAAPGLILAWLGLIALHAALYRFGDRIRARWDMWTYAVLQACVLFAIAISGMAPPLTLALFMAAVIELVGLAGTRWGAGGAVRITIGAIALFVLASLVTSDLYRAATAGLILAATGLITHAVAGLLPRPLATPRAVPVASATTLPLPLSARETEVLRELVNGGSNSAIATALGISERTVKAHLGSVYQKLGVESRSAAVAAAMARKLV
jgi:DNA-binding CsgD family transcriptional regulator